MEHQPGSDTDTAAGQASCPVCQSTVASARCQECGAALVAAQYRIRRLIAKSSHSRMYLAENAAGTPVALKELMFALVPEVKQLEAFDREAKLLMQLSHSQIPRFLESFRVGEGVQTRLYLAQEFVPGLSLLEKLKTHRFTEAEAIDIARQVLRILEYLHRLSPKILHRDIKPANLVSRSDESIALVDFGSARDVSNSGTFNATFVGTFGYMPPEQLGGSVDETSDLYALGATLVHLLSRKSPAELMKAGKLDFEGIINVSPAAHRFISRLVSIDRAGRFASANAALRSLDLTFRPSGAKNIVKDLRAAPIVVPGLPAQKVPEAIESTGFGSIWEAIPKRLIGWVAMLGLAVFVVRSGGRYIQRIAEETARGADEMARARENGVRRPKPSQPIILAPSAEEIKRAAGEMLEKAVAAYELRQYSNAKATLELFLAQFGGDERAMRARLYLGKTYQAVGLTREAIPQLNEVATRGSGEEAAEAFLRVAECFLQISDSQSALRAVDQAVASYPSSQFAAELRLVRGRLWMERQQFQRAVLDYTSALGRTQPGSKIYQEAQRALAEAQARIDEEAENRNRYVRRRNTNQ